MFIDLFLFHFLFSRSAFEVVLEQDSFIIVAKTEKERAEWLAAFYREITWAKLAYALEKVLMQEAFQVGWPFRYFNFIYSIIFFFFFV